MPANRAFFAYKRNLVYNTYAIKSLVVGFRMVPLYKAARVLLY